MFLHLRLENSDPVDNRGCAGGGASSAIRFWRWSGRGGVSGKRVQPSSARWLCTARFKSEKISKKSWVCRLRQLYHPLVFLFQLTVLLFKRVIITLLSDMPVMQKRLHGWSNFINFWSWPGTLRCPSLLELVKKCNDVHRIILFLLSGKPFFTFFLINHGLWIDEFRMVLGGQPTPCFFFSQQNSKSNFTLPVVNYSEIVWSTFDGVEEKSGWTCLMRYFRSCWCRSVLQFLVTLDNG